VIDLLGQGASGAVYLVTDERTQQKLFALKEVMHAARAERSAFPFDAAALKRLNHPALPRIYRAFHSEDSDRFYILMDYVEGNNLEVMRQLMPGKRFSLHTAMTLMSPIMDAVSYLHQQHPPLIHGDINPSNIIVPIPGTPTPSKLVDFGGVKNVCTDATTGRSTLNFRAPEQYGRRTSRRTDVYALGAIFYTLLTGAVPAAASDRLARIGAGEPDPLVPMDQFAPAVQTVARAIHCALSIRRHDRFDSVEQFREALWQVVHANQVVIQIPELAMVVPAEEHAGPPLSEPMIAPSVEGKNTVPDGNPVVAQAPELAVVGPAEEHTGLDAGPDVSTLEFPPPALIATATIQAEVTSAGPPLSPAIPGGGTPPAKVSSQERSPVLRRKKRRPPANGRANGTYKKHKRKARSFLPVVLVFLLVCVIGSGVATVGYQTYKAQYQHDVTLAQVGIKHLQTASSLMQAWSKKPLDAPSLTRAQHEFAAASAVFAQLDTDLHSFPGFATVIPGYGSRLSAALRVVPAAMQISQAGVAACDALALIISRLREPFGTGYGITIVDLAAIGKDLHQMEADVKQATAAVNALQPGDLQFDSRLGKAVASFHQYLPSLQALLHEAVQLLPVLPSLLGISAPAYFLVELLDSTELRPGGGFIKDYGFATFIGGRLSAAHITDANLLDTNFSATGQTLSYPPAYRWFDLASTSWNLRDSNLDADFPTAASYAEQNYNREGGKVALQGVMAITTTLIEHALAITGPIGIPELHETITAQNLVDRIHHYQLGPASQGASILPPGGNTSGSRYFTELLAQHFLARMRQLPSSVFPKLLQMLSSSLRTKDLQIYFNASPAENLLRLSHVDAAIQAPLGDSFFVVDANVAADKANQFITSALDDRVTIDGRGNATHHTSIRYAWLKNGDVLGSPLYSDYVRIYVPPGSSLQEQQGWQPRGASAAFDRQVWAGSITLSYGQTRTVTLTWTEKGVAKKDAAGWHYQYLVQRQAGTTWMLNVQVTLPSCVVRTHTSGGLISHNRQTTTLTQSLAEDTNLGIDYSC
jgi:serine/threonine protein kinase